MFWKGGGLVWWTMNTVVESGLSVLEVGWLSSNGGFWNGRVGGSTSEVQSKPDGLQLT